MDELLTSAQMRAIEQAAIASGAVTGLELMERAGRGVVEAVLAQWPELAATWRRAAVLCGPGNNGGDGFVIARLLRDWGWAVEVLLLGDPERLPPDARANRDRWAAQGAIRPLAADTACRAADCDLVVDALFGTGLARPLRPGGVLPEWLHAPHSGAGTGSGRPPVVAVDLPSGLCSDSGHVLDGGVAVRADLTVTFHARKLGHVLARGPALCGRVVVADIGLPRGGAAAPPAGTGSPVRLAAPRLPLGKGGPDGQGAHKYAHGHALILAGGPGRGGAARLAARAALRIGAGLATVGCPPEALPENAARLDAVMLRPLADADALALALEDPRIGTLCLGPGLGTGAREAGLLAAALGAARPTVLDADALTLLSRHPDLFARLHGACLLTPHAGEFARLFPDIAAKLAAPATTGPAFSKVDATRAAAARAGCTVLLKGADTVIADPSGRCAVSAAHQDRAAPWLATAGSGDVLAGFVAGLLARGFAPFEAAEAAAWLHVECALSFGPGLIAEDLPEELPKVLRRLGA
ncbi:MAG: NAD(P)H-hydrate dehydratase [Rhodobacteraceae bacterium]|nr:NAD(P)H-hydrate dehydratase [Paracoccaceae bacterium]